MRSDSIAALRGFKSGLRHMTGGKGPYVRVFVVLAAPHDKIGAANEEWPAVTEENLPHIAAIVSGVVAHGNFESILADARPAQNKNAPWPCGARS